MHDEILVESVLEEADEVSELTVRVMKSACELAVPLAVHVARGASWAEAKERWLGRPERDPTTTMPTRSTSSWRMDALTVADGLRR